MTHCLTPTSEHIRTVLHLTPAVTTAALVTAQRNGMALAPWLENLIVQACAATPQEQAMGRLSDAMSVELFAHVATYSPGLLTGRWKLLFDRCMQEDALWRYPSTTLDEAEAGEGCEPVLDAERLRKRWPALVAGLMLMP